MTRILSLIAIFTLHSVFSQQIDFLKLKKFKVCVLSDTLKENSTLDFFHNKLYTINDSGNSSEIFEINKETGKILNIISTGLKNTDWEAISSDSLNIYVGDFGNNLGTRKDLKIFKISFANISQSKEIPFFYPEQQDFNPKNLKTNFDAESMIFLNGKIHLFTKEWSAKETSHYIIDPNLNENQAAKKTETFQTDFVITDASYLNKKLYLVGYTKKTEVFLSIFNESEPGMFFESKPKKYYLGSALKVGQIEGIAVNETGIYISGEKFVTPVGKADAELYFIPFEKLK